MRTIRKLALCTLVGGVLAGCQSWPQTEGEVSVSRPQVFTRERLVNERLGEVNWLREQLGKPFVHGLQGFRDVREARAFVLALTARYDRAERRAQSAAADDRDAQRERDQELAQIRHEINRTQLTQQLEALEDAKAGETAPESAETKEALAKLSAAVDALGVKVDALMGKAQPADAPTSLKAAEMLQAASGRALNPNLLERSRADTSSRDRLEDEAAFRDFVNGRIREASLDDTHDLNGFSLFELKFDATIVPGSNTRRSAVAELSIQREDFSWDTGLTESFVLRLVHRLEEDANALIERQQRRADIGTLSPTWQQRIVGFSLSGAAPTCVQGPEALHKVRLHLQGAHQSRRRGQARPAADPNAKVATHCLITHYVQERLEMSLGRYFSFEVRPHAVGRFVSVALLAVGGKAALKERLEDLEGRTRPWVATVSPKEYAQNISDVATHQQIRQIGVSLGASDGKAASVQAQAEAYKQSQEIAQAIKRQPLAASFVRGDDKFGWVLGPKYEIQGSRAVFVHATARYTFSASVVVPGWHRAVALSGCGYWIERDGGRSAAFPLFGEGDCKAKDNQVKINLPNNHRALVHALMGAAFDIFIEPEIYQLPEADPSSLLQALRASPAVCALSSDKSCEQTLVIEGRDLWRNPSVFIGNQRADRVDVLPSMRGIVATFKHLGIPPPRPDGSVGPQDLFVSTSAGQDRLNNAVTIGATGSPPGKPFARLSSQQLGRVQADGREVVDIGFAYPLATFPRVYSAMALRLRKAGTSAWTEVEADATITPVQLLFRLTDPAKLGLGSVSVDLDCDLVFKFAPGDDWISMTDPAGMRATYFATRAEWELVKSAQANADFSASRSFGDAQLKQLQQALRFALPADEKLFFKAYPGLQEALAGRGGHANIALRIDEGTSPVELVAERVMVGGRTQIQPRMTSLNASGIELLPEDERSITYTISVAYRRGAGEPLPVFPTTGLQLTAKGLKKPPEPVKAAAAK